LHTVWNTNEYNNISTIIHVDIYNNPPSIIVYIYNNSHGTETELHFVRIMVGSYSFAKHHEFCQFLFPFALPKAFPKAPHLGKKSRHLQENAFQGASDFRKLSLLLHLGHRMKRR